MKTGKRILILLVVLIFAGGTATFFHFKNKFLNAEPNTLTVSNLGEPFSFMWTSHDYGERTEPHSAMFVPVRITDIDQTFYMQFDTGAPSTVLYYNKVKSINEKYGDVLRIDTLDNRVRAGDVSLNIGTVHVKASSLDFHGMGNTIDWSKVDSSSIIVLGTVGSDFMEHHPMIIDYQNNLITLTSSIPDSLQSGSDYLPFTFDGRKIFLSAELDGEPASLWFDSGSSDNELIVEEKTFMKLAKPGAERETYKINSWGTKINKHVIESEGTFTFGDVEVPLTKVSNFEWPNKLQVFILKAANIGGDLGGMTGNKLFIGKTLILDAPNLRYALIK